MNRTWSLRAFKKLLHENGYKKVRSGGHLIYSNGERTISITSNKINRMVAQRLIKENNLKEDKNERNSKDMVDRSV